jgi:hypothetical protein
VTTPDLVDELRAAVWQFTVFAIAGTAALYVVVRITAGRGAGLRALTAAALGIAGAAWAIYAVVNLGQVSTRALVAGLTLLWGGMLYFVISMTAPRGEDPEASPESRTRT